MCVSYERIKAASHAWDFYARACSHCFVCSPSFSAWKTATKLNNAHAYTQLTVWLLLLTALAIALAILSRAIIQQLAIGQVNTIIEGRQSLRSEANNSHPCMVTKSKATYGGREGGVSKRGWIRSPVTCFEPLPVNRKETIDLFSMIGTEEA